MRRVPRWALLSSGCGPVLLVSGWMTAALLHGSGYDPVTQTISLLAVVGAPGHQLMTAVLVALGACHLLTAWGLRPAALPGRAALAAGGMSAVVLAFSPAPSSGGSLGHGSVVAVGFSLLALWPVLAVDRSPGAPWGLRPGVGIAASVVMCLGGAWFLIELQGNGAAGVAERALTTAQSLWPFVVVLSCVRHPWRG